VNRLDVLYGFVALGGLALASLAMLGPREFGSAIGPWMAIGLVLVFLPMLLLAGRRMVRKKRSRFQDRADMSEDEFFATYYGDSGVARGVVSEVIQVVANATDIPSTKIRPSDRFDVELAPMPGWEFDDGLAEVSWFIRARMKKAGAREGVRSETVDALIRYIDQLEKREAPKPVNEAPPIVVRSND
jgi:hypothetical protein